LSAIQARKPASHPAKHQLGRLEDKLKVKTSKANQFIVLTGPQPG